jgi:hypothetical protein
MLPENGIKIMPLTGGGLQSDQLKALHMNGCCEPILKPIKQSQLKCILDGLKQSTT